MSIITLTTDYGNKDYSVSELKAKIYKEISDVRIVDVSHNISPFNLTEAAYIIKSAYRHFPKGSIHIIGIESDLTPENAHIAMKFDDNYFIGADNGIFSMIIGDFKADSMVEINIHKNYNYTITANDVFFKEAVKAWKAKAAVKVKEEAPADVPAAPAQRIRRARGVWRVPTHWQRAAGRPAL